LASHPPEDFHVNAAHAKIAECRKQVLAKIAKYEADKTISKLRSRIESVAVEKVSLEAKIAKAKVVQVSLNAEELPPEQHEILNQEVSLLRKSYKELCSEEQESHLRLERCLIERSKANDKYIKLLAKLDQIEAKLGEIQTEYSLRATMNMLDGLSDSLKDLRDEHSSSKLLDELRR
jgi:predicted nuclease with TOPRIM domain